MNQADLRTLAEERIKDAKALLDGKRWAFAYYVAGYAVECALKSCLLARMIHTGWIFQDKANIKDCLTHDFGELVKLAGLKPELAAQLAASAAAGGVRWVLGNGFALAGHDPVYRNCKPRRRPSTRRSLTTHTG